MKNFKTILELLVLIALVSVYAHAAARHPRIDRVWTNAAGTLNSGDTLTVYMRGNGGGIAEFDISDVAINVPMEETSPGLYEGTYVIPKSDQYIPFATVTGHLAIDGKEARLTARHAVSIKG